MTYELVEVLSTSTNYCSKTSLKLEVCLAKSDHCSNDDAELNPLKIIQNDIIKTIIETGSNKRVQITTKSSHDF